jgi:hypothetical protein
MLKFTRKQKETMEKLLLSSPNLTVKIPPLPLFALDFTEDKPPMAPRSQDPKRCCEGTCKKKLALSDFPCKCGKKFCSAHRIPEVHHCTYDFRANQKQILLQTMNTPVIAKKIDAL